MKWQCKPVATLCFILLSLSACRSEDAKVTNSTAPTAPTPPIQGQVKAKRGQRSSDPTIVFSEISANLLGTPTNSLGIGFLSGKSIVTRAFLYHFSNGDLPYDVKVFAPTQKGILVASKQAANETLLSLYTTRNRGSIVFTTLPSTRVTKLVSSPILDRIAWTDTAGKAWLLKAGEQAVFVGLENITAQDLELGTSTGELLISGVRANKPVFLLIRDKESASEVPVLDGKDPTLSPDGTKVAFIESSDTSASLMVFDTKTTLQTNIKTHSTPASPKWKNNHELTAVELESDGTQALHLLDTETGSDRTIAVLHLPVGKFNNRMICPAWVGANQVYFSDYVNARLSIVRAQYDGGNWNVAPFARPDDDSFGLACPQTYVGAAS